MNEESAKRIWAAAIAGWWTLLIIVIFMLAQWLIYLWMMSARPAWMLRLWGDGVSWSTIQTMWLWLVGVFKLSVWIMAAVVIWLTLWARRLRRG